MTPILLSDPNTRIAFLKDATKCEVTEERNGAFEIVLEYPVSGKYFKEIAVEKYIKAKPSCNGELQLFRIYAVSKPIMGTVTVNGEHISYKLSHYPIKVLAATKTTALVAIDRVLSAANQSIADPHKFTADFCDITTITQFGAEYCSARAALGGIRGSVLDCFGGEYEFDNFKIKLHKARGSNNGVSIRYGKNMTEMKLTLSAENSYTGIFPYYIDDDKTQTLTEGTIHVANNSKIDERILMMDFSSYFDDGEEKNETTLRAHVNKYLEDNDINAVEGSMTVSMIDLSKSVHFGYVAALETVSLCDTLKVVNTLMDVSVTMKVIKTVYDAIGEKYTTLELGTPSSDFADVIKQTQRTANEAYKKASQMPDTSALEQKFQNDLDDMTRKITGASGGHVILNPSENPQEFLILCDSDKLESAKKVYRFNSAGLAFSPNGYDGPYTVGLLGDDGKLIINNVTTRSISANLVKAGTIASESGDLLINLDDSQIISGATSPTRTVFEAGHLDLYYAGKYSGRIGQTDQNNIAIEGTDPDNPAGTPKTTDLAILHGGLYARDNGNFDGSGSFGGNGSFGKGLDTGRNEENLYKMIEHCRKTKYYSTAFPFPAYMRLGIGAPSGPSMSCELRLNDISDDAIARIDVYKDLTNVVHSGTASDPGRLTWSDIGDLMIKFAYKYGEENSGNLIRLFNNEFDFLDNILYVKDIRIVTKRTGYNKNYVSLKEKLGI